MLVRLVPTQTRTKINERTALKDIIIEIYMGNGNNPKPDHRELITNN